MQAMAQSTPVHPRARVLFIDDDVPIVKSVGRLLRTWHDVICVTSAREALALIGKGHSFDAVICDVNMPQMTGMDFYDELSKTRPDLASCTIFMTGGAFTHRAARFLDAIPNQCLSKPFDQGSILDAIARARR